MFLLPAKSTKLTSTINIKNEKLPGNTAESLVIWLRLDRERRKKVRGRGDEASGENNKKINDPHRIDFITRHFYHMSKGIKQVTNLS